MSTWTKLTARTPRACAVRNCFPRRAGTAGRGVDPGGMQDLPDRGARDRMAELDQFALHRPVPQRGLSVATRSKSSRIAGCRGRAACHSSHTSASSMTHSLLILHPPTVPVQVVPEPLVYVNNPLVGTLLRDRPPVTTPAPLRDALRPAAASPPPAPSPAGSLPAWPCASSSPTAAACSPRHPLRPRAAGKYLEETATCRQLPAAAPAPRLRWDGQIDGWIVLIFDDIDGRHPVLAPGSPDTGRVVAMPAAPAADPDPLPRRRRAAASRRTGRAGLRLARTGR